MNTNGLAKLYGHLTPRERLPLIMAAHARGDEAERDRLVRSAPCVGYSVPDHYGLAEGLQMQSFYHLVEMLNLAVHYWRCSGLLEEPPFGTAKEKKARDGRLWNILRLFAYLLTVKAEGWRRFCAELQIDGELLLQHLPGWETVRQADQAARGVAFTPEEATAFIRQRDPTGRAPTAEDEATGMREFPRWRVEWWG
jgi:hypothetical protein